MKNDMRSSGIGIVGNIPWGTHFSQFYQTKQDLIEIIIPYFKAGLENNELCIWIVPEFLGMEEIKESLKMTITNFDIYFEKGQIEIISCADWYLKESIFNSQKALEVLTGKINQGLSKGYAGLRLTEDTFLQKGNLDDFVDYEERLNFSLGEYPIIVLCTYSLEICSSIDTIEIATNHDFALGKKKGKWEQIKGSNCKHEGKTTDINSQQVKNAEKSPNWAERPLCTDGEKYREIFNSMGEAIQLCELIFDENGLPVDNLILDVNPAYEQHSGLKREQVIGRRIKEILPIVEQVWLDRYAEVVRTGTKMYFEEYNASLDMWFEVSASPLSENKFIAVFSNITKRKLAEKEIAQQARLLNLSYDAILIRDIMGSITYWNFSAQEIYGYTKEEALGRVSHELLYTEFPQPLEKILEIVYREGRWTGELIHTRKDGQKITVTTRWVLDRDSQDNPISILETNSDITERKQAEEALRKSESDLKKAQEIAHMGSWEWDLASNMVTGSDELYRLFGLTPDPTTFFQQYIALLVPEDRQRVLDALNETIKRNVPYNIDYQVILYNGKKRFIHAEAVVIYDNGRPVKIIGTAQDITERKAAEEKLAAAHSQIQSIIDNTPDIIYAFDIEERFVLANAAVADVLNSIPERMIGKRRHEFMPKMDADWHEANDRQVFEAGRVLEFEEHSHLENRSITWLTKKFPLRDAQGRIYAVAGISANITKRKQDEEALLESELKYRTLSSALETKVKERTADLEKAYNSLKESEEKYRNIIETANEGIVVLDSNLKATYVNKRMEELLGYSQEEIIGKSALDLTDEEGKAIVYLKRKNILRDISDTFEFKFIRKNGSALWTLVNTKSNFDKDGNFTGALVMCTDITKRKEAEFALERIGIARQKEIHHRIKNNLQVISSLLDLQADKFSDKETVNCSEVLKAFRESQDRVMSIALIHKELHEGKDVDKLNFSLYLHRLAESLFHTYRLESVNVSLDLDIEENIFFDMDTAVPLGMILNEIISNSFKYAFSGRNKGEIQINLYKANRKDENTEYILNVSDNGIGIPENIDFENPETLGLQLVSILVEQIDGSVKLKRNQGTEFTILFSDIEK